MFCQNCGKPIETDGAFCPHCGSPVEPPTYAGTGEVREGIPAPGFSDRATHPEILAAVKKNRAAGRVFAFLLVLAPPVALSIYGHITEKMTLGEALKYGGILSAVFLVFALIGAVRTSAGRSYDGTVTDKRTRNVYRGSGDDHHHETEYITYVKKDRGGNVHIVERENSPRWAYDYLAVGDRFRYHPQFGFPYELYDKRRAACLYCVACGRQNDVTADRCHKCGVPLLK